MNNRKQRKCAVYESALSPAVLSISWLYSPVKAALGYGIPCILRRWKRGDPRKLFLMVWSLDFQGVPAITPGDEGGVAEGL